MYICIHTHTYICKYIHTYTYTHNKKMAHLPKAEFFSGNLLIMFLSFVPIYMLKIKVRY